MTTRREQIGAVAGIIAAWDEYDPQERERIAREVNGGDGWEVALNGPDGHTLRYQGVVLAPCELDTALCEAEALMPEWLRRWREVLGLSQSQLAARLGVSQGSISRWESNDMAVDSPVMLVRAMRDVERQRVDIAAASA